MGEACDLKDFSACKTLDRISDAKKDLKAAREEREQEESLASARRSRERDADESFYQSSSAMMQFYGRPVSNSRNKKKLNINCTEVPNSYGVGTSTRCEEE